MSPKRVLLIGPGFIGGAVLQLLIRDEYQVTVLLRRESAATARSDVRTVLASLDDCIIIEDVVVSNDIVIHAASSRHLPSVEAVLAGLRRRAEAGNETIYIHTSGATYLADDSAGSLRGYTVLDDERPGEIESLLAKESRAVDLAILRQRDAQGAQAKILTASSKASGRPTSGTKMKSSLSLEYPEKTFLTSSALA